MRVSNVTVRKRLMIVLLVGLCIFAIIDARLGYVQFFDDWLSEGAEDLWSREIRAGRKEGKL